LGKCGREIETLKLKTYEFIAAMLGPFVVDIDNQQSFVVAKLPGKNSDV
jgi:hypothetical protein